MGPGAADEEKSIHLNKLAAEARAILADRVNSKKPQRFEGALSTHELGSFIDRYLQEQAVIGILHVRDMI